MRHQRWFQLGCRVVDAQIEDWWRSVGWLVTFAPGLPPMSSSWAISDKPNFIIFTISSDWLVLPRTVSLSELRSIGWARSCTPMNRSFHVVISSWKDPRSLSTVRSKVRKREKRRMEKNLTFRLLAQGLSLSASCSLNYQIENYLTNLSGKHTQSNAPLSSNPPRTEAIRIMKTPFPIFALWDFSLWSRLSQLRRKQLDHVILE